MRYDEAVARCWAEIDLDALKANYRSARTMAGGAAVIPVLKANAYGTGAARIAKALAGEGARLFAVATVPEALEIKRAVSADVLVMGMAGDGELPEAVRSGLILTAYSPEAANRIDGAAADLGAKGRVHLKIDTGLHRLGFDGDGPQEALLAAAKRPHLAVEGLYTHLALHDRASDMAQLARLERAREALARGGATDITVHALDSIGLTRYPEHALDAVRVGAWLYGVKPDGCAAKDLPVASFKARVAQVRDVAAGELIGYDDDHPLAKAARVATVACGYADGYARQLGECEVLINGARAKALGRACMDQMMVDATGTGAREGDVATLLGEGMPLDEYARRGNFNRNEALARLGRRVPRVYIENGRVADIADGMSGERGL